MSAVDLAASSWGDALPDWVRIMAELCDRMGLSAVAAQIGYSAAAVREVIKARYGRTTRGNLSAIETAFRKQIIEVPVICPFLGEITTDQCLAHQRARFVPGNPLRVALFRACRSGCVHSKLEATSCQKSL